MYVSKIPLVPGVRSLWQDLQTALTVERKQRNICKHRATYILVKHKRIMIDESHVGYEWRLSYRRGVGASLPLPPAGNACLLVQWLHGFALLARNHAQRLLLKIEITSKITQNLIKFPLFVSMPTFLASVPLSQRIFVILLSKYRKRALYLRASFQ